MDNSLLEAIHDTFSLESKDINLYAPLTLAYIGDAVFEIIIRTLIVEEKSRNRKKTAPSFQQTCECQGAGRSSDRHRGPFDRRRTFLL